MSLAQTTYFLALVGGLAGLVCWGLVVGIPGMFHAAQESYWLLDLVHVVILGGLIGGFTVGFADRWSGDRVVPRWVIAGTFIGLVAGGIGGLIQAAISTALGWGLVSRILSWLVTGAFIGFGTGLRWVTVNTNRVFHGLIGGLLGGALAGIVYGTLHKGDLSLAIALMSTGIGITLGVALAPVLLRDGILRFMSSGDPRSQNKYGPNRKEWELHDGDRYVVGSLSAARTQTSFAHEVQVYIPDAMVAERHAFLSGRGGRFYIELHPENKGPQGQPVHLLQVRGYGITMPQELRDGDDIIVGQTLLQFHTQRRKLNVR